MFKQLCRLQRYTFLHELSNVFNTFLHELSSYTYTFLHEPSSYYVHDNRFPILFVVVDSLHILPQFLIEGVLRHGVFVAQDDELHAGTRHRHVHAAQVFQESDLSFVIGPHQGDEDHVAFLSLESVHRVDADQAAVRLEELILLDEPLEVLHLSTIGRDDSHIDALVYYALLAYLGEVFRQGEESKLRLCLVDTAEALAHKLLFEVHVYILLGN